MDENQGATSRRAEHGWPDAAIRLALVALVVYWSFLLLRPFIAILIWAAILSVIRWVKDYYEAIHPHSGTEGGYVNFMSGDDHRSPANYGANYERLAAVKATYDPDNLFHVNQNILPAITSG